MHIVIILTTFPIIAIGTDNAKRIALLVHVGWAKYAYPAVRAASAKRDLSPLQGSATSIAKEPSAAPMMVPR